MTHYMRRRRHGDPSVVLGPAREPLPPIAEDERCEAPGCERRAGSRNLCSKHYQRYMRHGSVMTVHKAGRHANLDRPVTLCSEKECDNVAYRTGICKSHYLSLGQCAEPGCTRRHKPNYPKCFMHQEVEHCNQFLDNIGWCTGIAFHNGMCKKCLANTINPQSDAWRKSWEKHV